MNIIIKNNSQMPIYQQIYQQIKMQIVNRSLVENEMLPSMRNLAKDLRISVITTKRAYEELEKDGFIVTMTGKGSFVAAQNLELFREEQLKNIEGQLTRAIQLATTADVSLQQLIEMLKLLYEETQ